MNLDKSATHAVSADRKIRLFAAGELCLLQRRRGTALGAVDEEDIINLNNIQKSNL